MENQEIIKHIRINFPDELKLIERSLINHYSLKNKKDKTDNDVKLMNTIYSGVIKLFNIIGTHLNKVYGLDKDKLNYQIKEIFVKT
jgi:hypothetical protein